MYKRQLAYLFHIKRVRSFWPYILVGGTFSWFGLHSAHLHPALALVPIIPFLPSGVLTSDDMATATIRSGNRVVGVFTPLNDFQDFFKKPVDIGLLGFGLANAGVPFSSVGPATWAVLLSLVIGKTVGIFLFSMAAFMF